MSVKISHLLPANRKVYTDKEQEKYFEVHALGLSQLALMFNLHREAMQELVFLAQSGDNDFSRLVSRFPKVAVDMIAMAADVDDPQEIEALSRLPAAVQIVAMVEVWEATVPDPKRLKEVIASVRSHLKQHASDVQNEISNSGTLAPQNEPFMNSKKPSHSQSAT